MEYNYYYNPVLTQNDNVKLDNNFDKMFINLCLVTVAIQYHINAKHNVFSDLLWQ